MRRILIAFALIIFSACPARKREYKCAVPAPLEASRTIPRFDRVFILILENTSAAAALAQPFIGKIAKAGVLLSNYHGIARPSQPNYIAMTSGSTLGVRSNSGDLRLVSRNLVDLLEEAGKSWKVYAEDFPGNCFLGASWGPYVRKHVPFLSYASVQDSSERCARVVASHELSQDVSQSTLPDFAMFIPNNLNNGHDTGPAHADQWLEATFGKLLEDPKFMDGTLFVLTYDEGALKDDENRLATVFYGEGVRAGMVSETCYTHYNLLRTVEDALGLGDLGREDKSSAPVYDAFK